MGLMRVSVAVVVFSVMVPGQTAPAPGPELRALDAWLGKWLCDGRNAAGVTYRMQMQCEWLTGGLVLQCQPGDRTAIYGYSSRLQAYTLYRYGGRQAPWTSVATGRRDGNKVTFLLDDFVNGKLAKLEHSLTADPPGTLKYEWRQSVDGGPWAVNSSGTCKKP